MLSKIFSRVFSEKTFHALFLIGLLGFAVWGIHPDSAIRERVRFAVFDSYQEMKPRLYQGDVTIVDYDDASLTVVGQWPWPRNVTARIVDNLVRLGAKSIAFDGVMAEPDSKSPARVLEGFPADLKDQISSDLQGKILPDYDEIMARSIKRSKIFVTSFSHGSDQGAIKLKRNMLAKKPVRAHFLKQAQQFPSGVAQFLPALQKGAAGNGSFAANADIDGLIRKTGMIFTYRNALYPSLSLESVRVASDQPKSVYVIGENNAEDRNLDSDYRIILGDYKIPVDESGRFWVYYKEHDKTRDYVSAYKLLDAQYDAEISPQIKGKIILIGSSAEGLKDLRATPVNRFLPGVEIHANVIEQILHGAYLFRPDRATLLENSFILAMGLLLIIFAPFIGALWLGMLCFSVIGLSFFASWKAFVDWGALIDPVYPSLTIFVFFTLSTLLSYWRAERKRRQVSNAFGLYISPDFMKELTSDPDKLKLGGEIRDLTVMFSDIRSFTTISEGLTPTELIQLMNDFLTPMSDLVMQNRGTIDKYMGDAMMAFWNAPLDDEDHARNACHVALEMQEALAPINEGIKKRALAAGKDPVLLKAGIGLNTGPCAVGNMGSRQRFAYSTLGDAVNLSSRLEGQTKTYGLRILIGQSTWEQAPEFATLEMDLIQVKGKSVPVRIFALLGDEGLASDPEFQALKEQHEAMIKAYRAGEFEGALKLVQACALAQKWDLAAAYELYHGRCKNLIARPPEGEWSGVYIATSK